MNTRRQLKERRASSSSDLEWWQRPLPGQCRMRQKTTPAPEPEPECISLPRWIEQALADAEAARPVLGAEPRGKRTRTPRTVARPKTEAIRAALAEGLGIGAIMERCGCSRAMVGYVKRRMRVEQAG
jgi:hypothetical protein